MGVAQIRKPDMTEFVEKIPSDLWKSFLSAYNSLPVVTRNAIGKETSIWLSHYHKSHGGSPGKREITQKALEILKTFPRSQEVVFAIADFEKEMLKQVPVRR